MAPPTRVDVLIVGSGPVGSAFARTIRDLRPQATIAMVERGPVITAPPAQNVRNLPPPDRAGAYQRSSGTQAVDLENFMAEVGEPLVVPRPGTELVTLHRHGDDDQRNMPAAVVASNVGGQGSLWTCAVPRPQGSERIPFLADDEMDELLDVAERLIGKSTDAFGATRASTAVRRALAQEFGGAVQAMPLACQPAVQGLLRWSGSDVVLGDLLDSTDGADGFWLLAEHAATRIVLEGDRAVGVTVRPASGAPPFDIGADAVVVAADALRTPQVLRASGIRPAALGRYLNDQPQVVAAAFVDGVEAAATGSGEAGGDQRDLLTGVTWLPFDDAAGRPYHGQIMQMDASPILIGGDAGADPRPVVGIGIFATKEPLPDDRVVIDETRPDAFGLPGIRIEYELTERDRDAINGAMDLAARVAKAVGEYIPDGEPRLLPAGTSIHYQGTVRMGPSDDGTSVCDTDSRVWGTANVYVGGNGVIPTATACNPTLTSVALAVRAARRIAAELGAEAGR